MKYLIVVVMAFLISACGNGYKPTPHYAKDIFDEPVLVKVKIDPEDPNAGVFLQDEIAKMAVNRLNLTLTKNVNEAKGYILVNSYTINTTPLNYDDNGNIIRYSVNAAIEFAVKDRYGFWSKNIVASEYVSVKPEAMTSALEKEKAGKVAIKKGLDNFIVAVMQRSRKVGSNKKDLDIKQESTTTNSEQNNYENSYRYSQPTTPTQYTQEYNQVESVEPEVSIPEVTQPQIVEPQIETTTTPVVSQPEVSTTTPQESTPTILTPEEPRIPKRVNSLDISIIPTDDNTLIKDATDYR